MPKRTWIIAVILGLIGLLLSPLILSRVIPGVQLRYYFWLERKLNLQVLRDLEPFLIKVGVLRPARVRVKGGFRMVLDPRDLVPLSILRGEDWQPEVWESLVAALPMAAVFLVVGANIGIFTLKAVKQIGPEGKAIAFEPNPETAALLRDNVSANHMANVTV